MDVSLSRETQNSVYTELVKYEYQYDVLREKLDNLKKPIQPSSFSLIMFLVSTLLFVVPGVLYVYFYIKRKKQYEEDLKVYNETCDQLVKEIKKVCDDSRAVFFSRQK